MEINKIYHGNSLNILKNFPDASIDMCVTSPPYYGLRSYGIEIAEKRIENVIVSLF